MAGARYPTFRRNQAGDLILSDSVEGRLAGRNKPQWSPPLSHAEVDREARQRVSARGGDVDDEKDVLGEYSIQSGKYRGKRFRWLLENVPGYVGWFVGAMMREGSASRDSQRQLESKNALKRYVFMFEEGRELVRRKSSERGQLTQNQVRQLLASPHGSPEVLRRRIKQMTSLQKVDPIFPCRDESDLIACLDEYESAHVDTGHSSEEAVQPKPTPPPQPVERQLFQEEGPFLAPPPRTPKRRTLLSSEPVETQSTPPAKLSPAQTGQSEPFQEPHTVISSAIDQQLDPSVQMPSTSQTASATSRLEPVLYEKWRATLPKVDQQWVSRAFFGLNANNKVEFRLDKVSQLWNHPPQPSLSGNIRNRAERYFVHRLFLWMPVNIWGVQLHCPHVDADNKPCSGILTRAGMHQKTRLVVDIDCFYNMASEYLRCSKCSKKMVAWAHNIISQLDRNRQLLFPAILTAKFSCDKKVVTLLRQRGLGNSSSMVRKQLEELHGDKYLQQVHHYLTACKTFMAASKSGLVSASLIEEPPQRTPVPQHRWLMKVYQLDVLQRLDFIKASITSLFGTVLKLDSTKKITKKLAGKSAKTAMWATNVGNEHGQVIMSVLTANEGQGLADMISGLCSRYQHAKVSPPRLMYVDRDCCGSSCVLKYFGTWPFLLVRLDIWHFMQRLSVGCTTDAHPLYGTFMGRLSQCIFRWEEEDVSLLKEAKRAEMVQNHIPNPSDADVVRHIKADELALHCRRVTRGTRETISLISALILSMDGDKGLDILGVPLFDSVKMQGIWAKQSQHVTCLQDPDGVQLYTKVGTVKKGGLLLPKYKCARGSTSLESFHLHMNRFIPGTLASDVNFQVYLLDGIYRWNQDREREATTGQQGHLSYDGSLRHSVNSFSQEVLGKDLCSDFTVPGEYTGELIGLEYLYSQSTGAPVKYQETVKSIEYDDRQDEDDSVEEDEGFEESAFEDLTIPSLEPAVPQTSTTGRPLIQIPTEDEYRQLVEDLHHTGDQDLSPVTMGQSQPPLEIPASVSLPVLHEESCPAPSEQSEPLLELSPATSGQTTAVSDIPDDSDLDPDNVPGYTHVINLAAFLVTLREQATALTTEQGQTLIKLWESLSDFDKSRTRFPQRFSSAGTGRYRSPKKNVALGVTSIERAVLGPNSTRASWPDCNRYVEATVERLLKCYPSDKRCKTTNTHKARWRLIAEAYSRIQSAVMSSARVTDNTDIQLPCLNQKTITQWYNKKGKERDLKVLLQGINLPKATMTGKGAPSPKLKPVTLQSGDTPSFHFASPPDTAGMAKLKMRTPKPPSTPVVRPILPMPSTHAPLQFQFVLSPPQQPPATVQHVPITPLTVQTGQKRPYATGDMGAFKAKKPRQATTVKCPKCGEARTPPVHQQYMGYRYCGKTEAISFQQWRTDLKDKGVARKRKDCT